MNALSVPFRQLVDRKLWPLAILLIAAIAAVPMFLGKEAPVVPGPTASVGATAAAAGQAATQPIVTLGEPTERESSRKVLGSRKNPFKPASLPKPAKIATATSTSGPNAPVTGPAKGGSGSGAPAGGGGAAVPGVAPGTGTPVQPVTKAKTYELFSLKIRFGSTSGDNLANRSIKRLTALPKMAEPTLVYLGLKKDLRTAVFLIDSSTTVVGDGRCLPTPANCQNLELKKGQTAFIDVLDESGMSVEQYQLDFVKVLKKRTADARTAKASRHTIAKGGRKALRANISRVGGWTYDPETGVLIPPDGE